MKWFQHNSDVQSHDENNQTLYYVTDFLWHTLTHLHTHTAIVSAPFGTRRRSFSTYSLMILYNLQTSPIYQPGKYILKLYK